MEKIITVLFNVESEGYQALAELRHALVTSEYTISQAALIKKENGVIRMLDAVDSGINTKNDTAIGGLVGALVGILGGPLGMLMGGGIGVLTGSAIDAGDAIKEATMIERVTEQLVDGEVALIALEQEATPGAAQRVLSKFDVSIIEDDAAEVAEEIKLAKEAEKEMEREARGKLRESKKENRKTKIEENRSKLKADFEDFKAKFKKDN